MPDDTDLTTGTEEQGADSLAAPAPPLAPTIAQNQIAAGQVNHGDSRDWAENMVSGVQAALAGFGAAGRVNPGSGALAGVGAAARQGQERRDQLARERVAQGQRQQALNMEQQRTGLEQQRVGLEQRRLTDAEKQNVIENARQQAEQAKRFAMDDADLKLAQSRDDREAQRGAEAHMEFVQRQSEYLWQLQQVHGGPAKINGAESPEFEHPGEMEQWARANKVVMYTSQNGYIHRPVMLPDGKQQIWEVPDRAPDWSKIKDPRGNPMSGYVDPLGAMNLWHLNAETAALNAKAAMDYAQVKKFNKQAKSDETATAAREALDKATRADGTIDKSKMLPGQVMQIRKDMLGQWRQASAAVAGAQKEMEHDPEYFDALESPEKLAALKDKYGVSEAERSRDMASQIVAQLDGAEYKQGGGGAGGAGGAAQNLAPEQFEGVLGQIRKLPPAQAAEAIRTSTKLTPADKQKMLGQLAAERGGVPANLLEQSQAMEPQPAQ